MQEQFIKYLKAKTQDNTSFVEEIASVLDIGYDAAYRRVNNKTNLSLEESIILARHYKISLNKLFEVGSQSTILAELSPPFLNEKDLELWFKQSLKNILPLTKLKSASMNYSAKDIPLFHTLKDTHLSRYKMYVWLKDVNMDMAKSKISFDEFNKSIPDSLLQSAYELGETYNFISITELWNDYTIIGTLQQILYYFESGLISTELALIICDDLENLVNHLEKQTLQQSIIGSKNKAPYYLYKTDLHTLSNTIMVKTPYQKLFFQPFTVLTYFKIAHQPTCDLMFNFFEKQMTNSKLLVNAGEKDRTLFFNKMHQKINKLRAQIKIDEPFVF
ncbi:MAG: hypothetical protein IMY67_02360 [Bacteroidetes bacterium]|nr:hypothetical protein [Bacteroidota bacterium]